MITMNFKSKLVKNGWILKNGNYLKKNKKNKRLIKNVEERIC